MASEMAVTAAGKIGFRIFIRSGFSDAAKAAVASTIDVAFAPVLAVKDAEISELRSERDALAATVAELKELLLRAKGYVGLPHEAEEEDVQFRKELDAAMQEPSRDSA